MQSERRSTPTTPLPAASVPVARAAPPLDAAAVPPAFLSPRPAGSASFVQLPPPTSYTPAALTHMSGARTASPIGSSSSAPPLAASLVYAWCHAFHIPPGYEPLWMGFTLSAISAIAFLLFLSSRRMLRRSWLGPRSPRKAKRASSNDDDDDDDVEFGRKPPSPPRDGERWPLKHAKPPTSPKHGRRLQPIGRSRHSRGGSRESRDVRCAPPAPARTCAPPPPRARLPAHYHRARPCFPSFLSRMYSHLMHPLPSRASHRAPRRTPGAPSTALTRLPSTASTCAVANTHSREPSPGPTPTRAAYHETCSTL